MFPRNKRPGTGRALYGWDVRIRKLQNAGFCSFPVPTKIRVGSATDQSTSVAFQPKQSPLAILRSIPKRARGSSARNLSCPARDGPGRTFSRLGGSQVGFRTNCAGQDGRRNPHVIEGARRARTIFECVSGAQAPTAMDKRAQASIPSRTMGPSAVFVNLTHDGMGPP